MTITAEHSSGLHTVEPVALRAALTKQLADGSDFLSLTEMTSEARAATLADFPAYAVARAKGADGADECALLVKRSRYRIVSVRAVKLSDLPIPRRGGNFDFALVVVVEEIRTGRQHTRVVVHRPSGVEGLFGIRRNDQGACYRAGTAGLVRLVDSITGPVVVTGDWNLSLRRRWVRRYLTRHFPRFRRTWRGDRLPDRGTLGRRIIDFSLVRGFTVSAADVVRDFGASDHRAVRETHEELST